MTRDGVFRRKDSRSWWVCYSVAGRTVRESANTEKKGEAIEFRRRRLAEYDSKGVLGRALDKVTVRSLWEAAERDFKQDSLLSLTDLQARWRLHLEKFFGCFKAMQVTSDSISQFIERRQVEGGSNATINRELSLLRQMFKKGMEADPPRILRIPKIKMLDEGRPRMGFLSTESAEKLHAFARGQEVWFRTFVSMALTYGWRKDSELLSLRVQQVDLRAGKIRLAPGSTKSGEGREVPICTAVERLLRACIEGKTPDDHVFTYPDGSPVKDFRGVWAKAVLQAGVGIWTCRDCYRAAKLPTKGISIATMLRAAEPYSIDAEGCCRKCKQIVLRRKQRLVALIPHDLRRTFARDARTADISQLDVMAIGGWATPAVFQRYSIVSGSDQRDALKKLEAKRESDRRDLHVSFTSDPQKEDETKGSQVN